VSWVAEHRFRVSVIAVSSVFLLLFTLMFFSGFQLLHDYDARAASCSSRMDCSYVERYFSTFKVLGHVLSALMLVFPALAGILWGAMVARDLQSSAADTAGTTRATRRVVAGRIAAVTTVVVILTALLSVAVTWWQSPLDRLNHDPFKSFDVRGLAPVAYAGFAVVLGALVGMVVRGRLTAMATVLAAFAAVRVVIDKAVRPNLFAEVWVSGRLHPPGLGGGQIVTPLHVERGAWVLASETVSRSHRVLSTAIGVGKHGIYGIRIQRGFASIPGVGQCRGTITGASARLPWHPSPMARLELHRCVDSLHLRQLVGYIPTSSYWPLQWSESAIYLALAVAVGALCVRLAVRRAGMVSAPPS
jgi:hypothetical protein